MGRHPSRRHVAPGEAPIGRRIRRRRRDLGFTQARLAGPEYTKSFISQLEGGAADPSLDTLRFLSRRLHTSLSALAGDSADQRLAAVEGLIVWGREAARGTNGKLARRLFEVAAELAAAGGWDLQRAEARLSLAEYEIDRGDPAAASTLAGVAGLATALGVRGLARRDLAAGALALRQREDAAAASSYRSALAALGKTTRHPDLTVRAQMGLAAALGRGGDLKQAARRLQSAARLAGRYRLHTLHGRALLRLGLLRQREGARDEGLRLLQEAEAILDGTADHAAHFEALMHRGRAFLDGGDAAGALEVARRAAALAATLEDAVAKARAGGLVGRALVRQQKVAEGIAALAGAVGLLQAAGTSAELAEAAAALSDHHASLGEHAVADGYLAVAREAAQEIDGEGLWPAAVWPTASGGF